MVISSARNSSRPGSGALNGKKKAFPDSYVDETLFGSPKPKQSTSGTSSPSTKNQRLLPVEKPKSKSCSPDVTVLANSKRDTLTISKEHLERMLKSPSSLTAEQQKAKKKKTEAQMEKDLAQAKARQQLIAQMEEETRKVTPPSEMQIIRQKEATETIARAQRAMLEEREEVKRMSQMILHAKCMAVRDEQVAQKAKVKQAQRTEEKLLFEEMERSRLHALKCSEEQEERRVQERKKGAAILLEQLAEREQRRIRDEQLRRIEGEEMSRRIEHIKLEEKQAEEVRKAAAKALLEEVNKSNKQLEQRKCKLKQAELEEEQRIVEYIRLKDAREQEIAEEKERMARQRELEVAHLRAMQEKIQDTRSAQDEERARKYQDEYELSMRRKQQQEEAKQQAVLIDLEAARVAQMTLKESQKEEMQRIEQEEFLRIMKAKQDADEAQHHQEIERLQEQYRYQQRLLGQIEARRENKSKEKELLLEEGRKIRERLAQEKALLAAIKQEKLNEMKAIGIPERYTSQLARAKPKRS